MDEFPEPFATLIREHRTIESVVADARAVTNAVVAHEDDADFRVQLHESLRDLVAFMDIDLTRHIAKEEQVLFPALRLLGRENEVVVEDMIDQHDSVRERHASLQKALATLDDGHEDVRATRDALSRELSSGIASGALDTLREIVRQLDSILQGHFFDEEDGLFEPALALVPESRLVVLHEQMQRIDENS